MSTPAQVISALLIGALGGLAIVVQSTLNGIAGQKFGSVTAGIMVIICGGLFALVALIIMGTLMQKTVSINISAMLKSWHIFALAGFAGIVIVICVAFVIQKFGVSIGLSILICTQILLGILFDALGWNGSGRISITPQRILGSLIMVGGAVLMGWKR